MKKVIFLGQLHYFNCCIPDETEGWEIQKIDLNHNQFHTIPEEADVWILFRPDFLPSFVLERMKGKKVWVSTEPIERADTIDSMRSLLKRYNRFDLTVHYDKTHIQRLKTVGLPNLLNIEFQLPVNLKLYRKVELPIRRDLFFGGRSTSHRETTLALIKRDFNILHVAHGSNEDDWTQHCNESIISLNVHIENTFPQLQHRMQNMIATGAIVFSERLTHDERLRAGIHYVAFRSGKDLYEKVQHCVSLCKNNDADNQYRKIAKQGYDYVRETFDANKEWDNILRVFD